MANGKWQMAKKKEVQFLIEAIYAAFAIFHLPFAIPACHLPFAICHLPSFAISLDQHSPSCFLKRAGGSWLSQTLSDVRRGACFQKGSGLAASRSLPA
jgi:hypothetical protein